MLETRTYYHCYAVINSCKEAEPDELKAAEREEKRERYLNQWNREMKEGLLQLERNGLH